MSRQAAPESTSSPRRPRVFVDNLSQPKSSVTAATPGRSAFGEHRRLRDLARALVVELLPVQARTSGRWDGAGGR